MVIFEMLEKMVLKMQGGRCAITVVNTCGMCVCVQCLSHENVNVFN